MKLNDDLLKLKEKWGLDPDDPRFFRKLVFEYLEIKVKDEEQA